MPLIIRSLFSFHMRTQTGTLYIQTYTTSLYGQLKDAHKGHLSDKRNDIMYCVWRKRTTRSGRNPRRKVEVVKGYEFGDEIGPEIGLLIEKKKHKKILKREQKEPLISVKCSNKIKCRCIGKPSVPREFPPDHRIR